MIDVSSFSRVATFALSAELAGEPSTEQKRPKLTRNIVASIEYLQYFCDDPVQRLH